MSHPAPLRVGPHNSRIVTDATFGQAGTAQTTIDTGADSELMVDAGLAARAGVIVQTDIASVGSGGMFVEKLGRLADAQLGGLSLTAALVRINNQVDRVGNGSAVVGMSFLSRFNLRFDLQAGKMELDPRASPPFRRARAR